MSVSNNSLVMWILTALMVLGGCAAKRAEDVRLVWPVPPDQPRLEFITAIVSKSDITPAYNLWSKMGDLVAGPQKDKIFLAPQGVHAAEGKLWVVDSIWRNVFVVNLARGTAEPLFSEPIFKAPIGIDVDANGTLYVVDSELKKVLVMSPDGDMLRRIGDQTVFEKPEYIAINPQNTRIYVSDTETSEIVVFSLSGEYLSRFGGFGESPGEFIAAHGMAIDELGHVFVADTGNARIQVFDADGRYLYAFGQKGVRVGDFQRPYDVAFDREGHLYILDCRLFAMLVYSKQGDVLLAVGGQPTDGKMGFTTPTAIDIDREGEIFISDLRTQRVNVWQYLDEKFLLQHPITDQDLQKLKGYLEKQREKNEQSKTSAMLRDSG